MGIPERTASMFRCAAAASNTAARQACRIVIGSQITHQRRHAKIRSQKREDTLQKRGFSGAGA
jgi:hypothetical protein